MINGQLLNYAWVGTDESTTATTPTPLTTGERVAFTLAADQTVVIEYGAEAYGDEAGVSLGMSLYRDNLPVASAVQIPTGAHQPMAVALRLVERLVAGSYVYEMRYNVAAGQTGHWLSRLFKISLGQ